ncbi:LIM domain-binding protein 2 [Pteropus alecto]|uniref:LIM domain-binding protein 2 n=1 Tax=Pteropus alecto TaxID=9402 RepID=L5K6R8_PTEAL|nr:LIM domain-binding protein 2 [Pteropus alecto]
MERPCSQFTWSSRRLLLLMSHKSHLQEKMEPGFCLHGTISLRAPTAETSGGAIGRTLIPRYFSTVFEGGVTDLYYILKHSKESYHNSSITVDCDQCAMVTQHGKPMFTKVCTEGRLILEFTFDDLMRIKTWHFTIRQYRELVPRSILAMHAQDPQVLDQLSKNITRMGLTNFTLNYLRNVVPQVQTWGTKYLFHKDVSNERVSERMNESQSLPTPLSQSTAFCGPHFCRSGGKRLQNHSAGGCRERSNR